MPVGRPFGKGNHFGRGRPKGSRNRKTVVGQLLLDSHAEAVLTKALELAENGDGPLLRFFLGYILPEPKELPIKTGPLPMGDAAELSKSSKNLMEKTTAGKINLRDASAIADLMEHRRQILKTEDHEMRLRAVEKQAREAKAGGLEP
jgi:hypothetical protein